LVDLLNEHAQAVFDMISLVVGIWIDGLTALLIATPPFVLIGLLAGLAYILHRSLSLVVFTAAALLLVINLGYWHATLETLSLVICSTVICVIIGLPVGVAAAHRPWLYTSLRPILDLM
jgi:glycine betaine/proline transport system permease protein